jgi:mevalonate pyrophosphate decarboxylase
MKIGQIFEEQVAPNIALIKYWGKLEKHLNIPLNGSISLTLDKEQIYSKCRSKIERKANSEVKQNQFHLYDMDNILIETKFHKKFPLIINFFVSEFCRDQFFDEDQTRQFEKDFQDFVFIVEARNNFPSSAGLASSASGACALVLSLSRIFNYFQENEDEILLPLTQNVFNWFSQPFSNKILKIFRLCTLLRIVSGSSSRSLYPGLVLLTGIQDSVSTFNLNEKLLTGKFDGLVDVSKMKGNLNNSEYFFHIFERFNEAFKEKTVMPSLLEKSTEGSFNVFMGV